MHDRYRKRNPAEIEARYLLIKQGWDVARSYGTDSPPDLFAMREGEFLLLMIRHSRRPVPDASAVILLYGEDLDRMRMFGKPDCLGLECWVLAPPDGWKCYEILPGGIRRIWRKGVAPEKEDALEPAVVYGETCENSRFSQQVITVEGGEACEDGRVSGQEGEVDQISLPWTLPPRQETSFCRQEIKGYAASTDVEIVPEDLRRKEPEIPVNPASIPVETLKRDAPGMGLTRAVHPSPATVGTLQADLPRTEPEMAVTPSSTTVEMVLGDTSQVDQAVNLVPDTNPEVPQKVTGHA